MQSAQVMTGLQLDNAIKVCENRMKNCRPSMKEKYENAKKIFENAKKKRSTIITKLKEKKEKVGDKEVSVYDQIFGSSDENLLTLEEIGKKLAASKRNMTTFDVSGVTEGQMDTSAIVVKRDFVDMTKDIANDFGSGRGLAVGLTRGALGVGIVELLTKGVTSLLVKNSIMQESFGIIGLAKKGIEFAPAAWTGIKTALSACWGFSPLATVALPAALAIAAIPIVKRGVDKLIAKHNLNKNFQENFEKEVLAATNE